MSIRVYDELVPVLQSVNITSPMSFTFREEPCTVFMGPTPVIPGYNHPLPDNPLVRDIQARLYSNCYAQRLGDPAVNGSSSPAAMPDPSFVQHLSSGNQSQSHWDAGWTIYGLGANGQIFIQKGERQRSANPGEFIMSGPPGMSPMVGAVVSILVQREANGMQPGMYFAFSDTLSDVWDEFALLRYYFHSTAEAAPDLMRYLTSSLNKYEVPFRLKGLVDPATYTRTDAVVLYVAKRYFHITARIILSLPSSVDAGLRESVPLFSKKMRRGVGLAEEPNTGESFGMHRCRLTAEGMVDAWYSGNQTAAGRMQAIGSRFALNNLNLEKPYLNPGSEDLFDAPEAAIQI